MWTVDETDSYMYQSVGHDAIDLYADAAGLPLYREYVRGRGLGEAACLNPAENPQ